MAGMRLFGVSANLLSLGGIDFGMIVGSGLVIGEHLMAERGDRPSPEALPRLSVETTRLVAGPMVFVIALITMVYLLILTLQGIEGKMFRPMAQTVIMALLVSLAYGFVGIPLVANLALRGSPAAWETRSTVIFLRRYYESALDWSRTRPGLLAGIVVGIVAMDVLLGSRSGVEFVPRLEEGSLVVTATTAVAMLVFFQWRFRQAPVPKPNGRWPVLSSAALTLLLPTFYARLFGGR